MRNRAKCRLCQAVVESFHKGDVVACKCGEITIAGGPYELWTQANDYNNFLRVDDEGNEIIVKYVDKSTEIEISKDSPKPETEEPQQKLSRKDKIDLLAQKVEELLKTDESDFHLATVHYSLTSLSILLLSILKED